MNQTFQPDIVVITEQLTRTLNDKKKTLSDFLKAIQQVAEIEEAYSIGIEKIGKKLRNILGNDLNKIVETSLKDSFTDIIQYIRNYLCIASDQSKTFVLQLKRDVISELQESVYNDSGWLSQVELFQKKHSNEIKRNIEQLNQFQEEYVQALYEEIRFQKNSKQPKKHNYQQSELKLQNFILYYNQYLDTYFQDIAQIQDIFYNVEIDRRKYIQDAGMKFFMFEISMIRNLQYDVASITQKIEQYSGVSKNNEFLILQSDDKPLLSKLNVENYIQILQQQLNFNDLCLLKPRQSSTSSNQDKKVDVIQASQQTYNHIFTQAIKYSNMNNEIIKQLTQMIQRTKPQQYYDSFVQTIQKIFNTPSEDLQKIDCAVTPTTYVTCLHISNILLDYCDSNYSNANLVTSLYQLSKNIYKLLSIGYEDSDLKEIKLTLFEGLLSHRILKNAKLWIEYAQSIETFEIMKEINCDQDILQMVKKKLKS